RMAASGTSPSPGAAAGFFTSRWVDVPESIVGVRERGLPQGFRAAGVAARIRPAGPPHRALLVSHPEGAVGAGRFTRSGSGAPAVLVSLQGSRCDALRAGVVTSGSANAGTGRDGFETARQVRHAAAEAVGIDDDRVAVCATGVIG